MMQLRKFLLVCYLLLCCQSVYSQTTTTVEIAPDDPYAAVPDVPYISDNLVGDPLSWTGPDSQGDCTYRPSGQGAYANDARIFAGDWFSNPGYRGCPQISEDGTMRFSWRPEDNMGLVNTIDENSMDSKIAAYAAAFGDLGITVNGYTYSWEIKSKDAEDDANTIAVGPYDKKGLGYSQDLLSIQVEFLGETNEDVLFDKTYDYDYQIANWTTFSGQEDFELDGKDVSKIRMTINGYDAGYRMGYYGPEVRGVQLQLLFTVTEVPVDCAADPGSSPTCYGYQDAFNQSIGIPTQAEMIAELEEEYGGGYDGATDDFTFDGTDDGVPNFDGTEDFDGQDDGGIIFDFELTEAEKQEMDREIESMGGVVDDYGSTDGSFKDDGQMIDDGQPPVDDFMGDYVEDYSGVPLDDFGSEPDQFFDPIFEDIPESSMLPVIDDIFVQELDPIASELTSDIPDETPAAPSVSINPVDIAKGAVAAGSVVANIALSEAATSATISSSADVMFSTTQSNTSSLDSQNQSDGSYQTKQTNTLGQIESNMDGGFSGSDNGYGSGSGMDFGNDTFIDNNIMDTSQQDFNSNFDTNLDDYQLVGITIEIELETLTSRAVNAAIQNVVNTLIDAGQIVSEEEEQSPGLDTEVEDALVEAALSGDTSEDAQAALLGYNPVFRSYQTPQIPDTLFYAPKDIYGDQKNYDNPNSRFFNGASDALHKEMVRQQYERN